MHKIVVTRRSDDYHASISGQSGLWGCGKTESEAIGDLVQSHPEALGITVERDYSNSIRAAAL